MKILFTAALAFITAYLLFPLFIKFISKKNILDKPGGRKVHTKFTPSMGGVPIFVSGLIALMAFLPFKHIVDLKYFLFALGLIFLVGLRDDYSNLKPYKKLVGQLIAIALLVVFNDIRLTSFYGLFGVQEVPVFVSYGFSTFFFVVVTNSFNLIDGIDGLAGSVALISLLFFGIWFYSVGYVEYAQLSIAFGASVFAFLRFNWMPSKIFMGDTGSLLLGFLLATLSVQFIEINDKLSSDNIFRFKSNFSPVIALIIVPFYDTIRVFSRRIYRGRSPFSADKTHLHHILLRLDLNHAQSTMVLVGANLFFVILILLMREFADAVMIPIIISGVVTAGAILSRKFFHKVRERSIELKERNQKIREVKILDINRANFNDRTKDQNKKIN